MSQNDPYMPPQGGQYIPPPPPYQATSDIPPQSPYHYSPAPQGSNRSTLGWLGSAALAVWAVVKYGLVFLVKIPALATLFSALVSFGAYSLLYGAWFPVAVGVRPFAPEMALFLATRRR